MPCSAFDDSRIAISMCRIASISLLVAFVQASAPASPSSAPCTCSRLLISSSDGLPTLGGLLGAISMSPSAASMRSDSRSGVRLIPRASAVSLSGIVAPGFSFSSSTRSRSSSATRSARLLRSSGLNSRFSNVFLSLLSLVVLTRVVSIPLRMSCIHSVILKL